MMTSWDPGKRSGWATWSDDGVLREHGMVYLDEALEMLRSWPFDAPGVVVYEDFRLDHRAAKQKGSMMEASQIIGALKLAARTWGAITVPQRTESRGMGYLHARLAKAGSHGESHDRDAVAHGFWWWEAQGVQPSIGEHRHLLHW